MLVNCYFYYLKNIVNNKNKQQHEKEEGIRTLNILTEGKSEIMKFR